MPSKHAKCTNTLFCPFMLLYIIYINPIFFLSSVCLKAMEVERVMSTELQALKQELRQKGSHNREQDEELISAMREQVQSTYTVQI